MLTAVTLAAVTEITPEPVQRAAWEIVVMVIGGCSAALAILGGVWWLLKPRIERWATEQITGRLDRVERQVTPNGGNTDHLGDRIVRVEQTLNDHIDEAQRWRSEDETFHRGQEREMGSVHARLSILEAR